MTDGPPGPAAALDAEVELGFRFDAALEPNPPVRVSDALLAEHLAHAIAAEPGNLLRHAQRVFLFVRTGESDRLFSALVDLFIALGGKGTEFRRRLLDGSRRLLASEQFGILSDWLEHGPPPGAKPLPPTGHSVLSSGIAGERELVKVSYGEGGAERDPLIEARERVEYFQIAEARELLEASVLDQPEREELHTELVQVYRATRDIAGLQAMREKLRRIMPQLPECWGESVESSPGRGGEDR